MLTRTECEQLVSRAEAIGFAMSLHQGKQDEGFRRGGRAVLTDGGLAAEIFSRMAHRLPNAQQPLAATAASTKETIWPADWGMPCGVWEQLRVLSYNSDDFFLPHRDNACAVGRSAYCPHARHTSCLPRGLGGWQRRDAVLSGRDRDERAEAPSRPTSGAIVDVVPG